MKERMLKTKIMIDGVDTDVLYDYWKKEFKILSKLGAIILERKEVAIVDTLNSVIDDYEVKTWKYLRDDNIKCLESHGYIVLVKTRNGVLEIPRSSLSSLLERICI